MTLAPAFPVETEILSLRGPAADRDALAALRQVLVECEDLYPGIDLWLDRTALPGVLDGARTGLLAFRHGEVVGASLVKTTSERKLCSLRVLPGERGHHVGTALFLRAAEVLSEADGAFHFTAPESLAVERRGFFESIGFRFAGLLPLRYRCEGDEHVFVGEPAQVAAATKSRLASSLFGSTIVRMAVTLMSLKPRYAAGILGGTKRVEVRKRFSSTRAGSILILYATDPRQEVVGWARVRAVRSMKAADVWRGYGSTLGCGEADFHAYAAPQETVAAIELADVHAFPAPFPRRTLESRLGERLTPPQSYLDLGRDDGWTRALRGSGVLSLVE